MSAEPESGELAGKPESEEVQLRLVELGDAIAETRQWGGGFHPDSAYVPSSYPVH